MKKKQQHTHKQKLFTTRNRVENFAKSDNEGSAMMRMAESTAAKAPSTKGN